MATSSLSFTACFSLQFSGRLSRHHRLPVSIACFSLVLSSLNSVARTLSICYSSKDVVPFGMECISSLFQGKTLCPFCKKPSIGSSQVIFPFIPGDALHLDAAIKAINPPPGIQEKYGDAPQRNELKTPRFLDLIPAEGDFSLSIPVSFMLPFPYVLENKRKIP